MWDKALAYYVVFALCILCFMFGYKTGERSAQLKEVTTYIKSEEPCSNCAMWKNINYDILNRMYVLQEQLANCRICCGDVQDSKKKGVK